MVKVGNAGIAKEITKIEIAEDIAPKIRRRLLKSWLICRKDTWPLDGVENGQINFHLFTLGIQDPLYKDERWH